MAEGGSAGGGAGTLDRAPADRAGRDVRRRWAARGRRLAGPAALVAVSAAVYAAYSLLCLYTFRASSYDLVIFDQAVRSYSGFGPPVAIVKGVHNGFGPDFSVLGDHFSPILAVLAPLYWIHDGPGTLLVAQAVLFAAAIVPIFRYAQRRLGRAAAYCASGAYALSWPVAEALAFDFHEVAFVPLLSALLIERHDARRRGQAAAVAVLLLLVKEDMGLLLAGFGLYLLTRRGERRSGAVHIAAGLAATWVASRLLIPAAGGDENYYWAYGALGPDLPRAAVHAVTHPWDVLALLGDPPAKLGTMLLLAAPLLLLPLASPLALVAVPLLAERMLADGFENWWQPQYHYNAFVIAVLVMAAVDGAVRLRGRVRAARRGPRALPAAGLLVAAALTVPFFAFGDLADPSLYRRDARVRAAAEAAAHVPSGALVEAANSVGPALSARTRVLLLDRWPRSAPWVVADVERLTFPFRSVDDQRVRVRGLLHLGYREVYRSGGYVVLHHSGYPPTGNFGRTSNTP
ncbi:DUF2079 domain-containing protein [Actinomadura sp. WMMB 499]|uniref:DUF2079 domain-containing protein n=1 Tax=Actinomadura sp. WMMB 499 TaxID=1219491 RepID=UPI0012449E12|nr:DUF2079 domain-containing protein [Actinomadura sp. WMMB 499]QFG25283.1 DUF2079 domain-containing protein [Actinomadura sp. WMMB 499]